MSGDRVMPALGWLRGYSRESLINDGLAAIIVPFILGVYWKKANRTGAVAGMASGLVTWLVTMQVWPNLPSDFMGLGASLVVMLVVSPLTQRIDPPRPLADSDGNPVEV